MDRLRSLKGTSDIKVITGMRRSGKSEPIRAFARELDEADSSRTTSDGDNCLGTDKYGNEWHARLEPDGSQAWTTSRGGTIQNGDQNNPPRGWDSSTGLNNNPLRKR